MKQLLHRIIRSRATGRILAIIPGNAWRGPTIGRLGYTAWIMAQAGDRVLLAGIFNPVTVRNFSTAVGSGGKVLVIEANPANCDRLREAVADLANVEVTNAAVWHEDGEIEFEFADAEEPQGFNRVVSDTLQSFPHHMVEETATTTVDSVRLDSAVARSGLDRVDHVNLTINGAEIHVGEALANLRREHPKMRVYTNTEVPDPGEDYIELLSTLGFSVATSDRINVRNERIRLRRVYAY